MARPKTKDPILRRFGETVRQYRQQRGLSQEALAQQADLHPGFIGMLERAERNPTLQTIAALGQALDVPPWKLIRRL